MIWLQILFALIFFYGWGLEPDNSWLIAIGGIGWLLTTIAKHVKMGY